MIKEVKVRNTRTFVQHQALGLELALRMDAAGAQASAQTSYTALYKKLQQTANAKYFAGTRSKGKMENTDAICSC